MLTSTATGSPRGCALKSGRLEMNFDGQELLVLKSAAAALFLLALLTLSLIDLRIQRLPDKIVLPMLGAGLAANAGALFTSPLDAILGAVAGYGSLWLLAALYSFRTPGAFGGGDLKLAAMIGAWLGASALPLVLLVAFVSGTCVALPLVLTGICRLDQRIPFGPALALGGAAELLAPLSGLRFPLFG
jgi:leader peptidase (prepilin peptidase)/N-methyltransferase